MLCMGVAVTITVAVALFTYNYLLWVVAVFATALLFFPMKKYKAESRWMATGVLMGLLSVSMLVMHQVNAQSLLNKQFTFIGEVYATPYQQYIKVKLDNKQTWFVQPNRELEGLETGDRLKGSLTVKRVAYDTKSYMFSRGILLKVDVEQYHLVQNERGNFAIWTQKQRSRITERAMLHNGNRNTATTLAFCFSDSSYLPKEQLLSFRACGISHLLSVSGLHLTILVTCFMAIGESVGMKKKRKTMLGVSAAIIIFFAAGMSAGAFRSAVMMCLLLIGQSIGRKSDSLNTLGFVALICMLLWPTMISDLSYIFSMLITAGIFVLSPKLAELIYLHFVVRFGDRGRRKIWTVSNLIAVNTTAQLCAVVLSALFFGNLPIFGGIIGFLSIPLMYPLLLFGFAAGFLFLLGFNSFGGIFLSLANVFSYLVTGLAETFAKSPFASMPVQYLGDYLALFMIVIGILLYLVQESKLRKMKSSTVLYSLSILLVLIFNIVILPSCTIGIQSNSKMNISVIDSLRGAIVIDTGVEDRSLKYRKSQTITKPENILCLVVTNPTATEKMINNAADYWHVPHEQVLTTQNRMYSNGDISVQVISEYVTQITVNNKKIVKYWGNYATIIEAINDAADVVIDHDGNVISKVKYTPVLRWLDGRSSLRIFWK